MGMDGPPNSLIFIQKGEQCDHEILDPESSPLFRSSFSPFAGGERSHIISFVPNGGKTGLPPPEEAGHPLHSYLRDG